MNIKDFREKYSKPQYIGDSIYAHFDGFQIVLETHNGLPGDPSNTIYLEPFIIEELMAYKERLYADSREVTNE